MKRINLLQLLILTSCVSVSLQKPIVLEKSKTYSLVVPSSPYANMEQEGLDQYWRHSKNGNAISLQTACSENYDPSLQDLQFESVQGIDDANKVEEAKFTYNERQALKSEYHGFVDGIPVAIHIISLKKNNCSYVISYFGKKTSVNEDKSLFDSFIKNFKVK